MCFDHIMNSWYKDRTHSEHLFKQDYEGYRFPEEKGLILDLIEEGLMAEESSHIHAEQRIDCASNDQIFDMNQQSTLIYAEINLCELVLPQRPVGTDMKPLFETSFEQSVFLLVMVCDHIMATPQATP